MFKVEDKRSMVVVAACHCVLNQNAKLEGIAGWPGMIDDVVKVIRDCGVGILQIPCPEMIYEGIGRFDKSIEQYDCPAFHSICKDISVEILDQLENYIQWGYQVPAILAIDGSPSCGFNLTQSAAEWRGIVVGKEWKKVRYINKPGILMKYIANEIQARKLDIPIIGIPEIPELGSLHDVLGNLEAIIQKKGGEN